MFCQHLAPPHVLKHFPYARRSDWLTRSFVSFARDQLHVREDQIASLLSVCSDDLNSIELPDTRMVGPFVLGGLDGYPFVGKTGLAAFSHHVPDDGVALMFFGPHVGITNDGQVGRVVRPGQSKASSCCGAAQGALDDLEQGRIKPKTVAEYDLDDFQQESLRQFTLIHCAKICSAGPPGGPERYLTLTHLLYEKTLDSMTKLLASVDFEHPVFAFGGVLINEDGGVKSDIDVRKALHVQNRAVIDVTEAYRKQAGERFHALEQGNVNAFD